jgi:hypothetical protein
MMFPTHLMETYIQSNLQQDDADRSEKLAIGREGMPLFEINVRVWLWNIRHEVEQDDARFEIDTTGDVYFILPFRWDGLDCEILSGPWGRRWKIRPHAGAWLKVHIPAFDSVPHAENIRLPRDIPNQGIGEYNEIAKSADGQTLGEFFHGVNARVSQLRQRQAQEAAARKERQRVAILFAYQDNFLECQDVHAVQAYLAKMIAHMPQETDRWKAAATRRINQLNGRIESFD